MAVGPALVAYQLPPNGRKEGKGVWLWAAAHLFKCQMGELKGNHILRCLQPERLRGAVKQTDKACHLARPMHHDLLLPLIARKE
jgi:hypothetical protein